MLLVVVLMPLSLAIDNDEFDSGGDGGDGGGRESNGGVGCGRADDNGDDEDDNGSYGGSKSDNVTTVTGTVAMGFLVAAVAKATMMTLCQCTRVKHSTTQQVAAAVAVVDGEDGVQWWRWGGAFDGRECGTVDEMATRRDSMQQPSGTMRRREGGATKGRREVMRQPADVARRREGGMTRGREGRAMIGDSKISWHDKRTRGGRGKTTRGLWDGRQCNNQPC